jgi:ABC-type branched-subunit amino acid transport system substrate-binding protein
MTRSSFPLAGPLAGLVAAAGFAVGAASAAAAEPIKIGITTVLSGANFDRGQSEQYGAQLALNQINEAGGLLGRPVEAYYADNAAKPDVGVPAVHRLIEQEHVSLIIGALATPVTHAIMPVIAAAKIPLLIATSAGQDFVDASGVGGNDYAFKTIPSELDIARALTKYLKAQNVKSVAVVADASGFSQANAKAMVKAAEADGLKVTDTEVLAPGTTDFTPALTKLKDSAPDQLITILGPFTSGFLKAYEAFGWKVPLTGRIDPTAAMAAVSPAFRDAGGLATMTSVVNFSPLQQTPGVQAFVTSYRAHYGIMPTQRAFYVYEATLLAADAIRRANSDQPADIEKALKTTSMPSALGGTYAPDDHNHAHTPLLILGVRDGKPAVIATE